VQKRLMILFVLLGLATIYSMLSLVLDKNIDEKHEYGQLSVQAPQNTQQSKPFVDQTTKVKRPASGEETSIPSNESETEVQSLPFQLKVVGISVPSEDLVDTSKSALNEYKVLVQYEGQLYKLVVNDFIGNSNIRIANVFTSSINVEYEKAIYTVELTPPNLLASDFKEEEVPYRELLAMSAKDIGTRPRIIQHLISLTPTPYIADGMLISPGMNPALFEQAGFIADDVLKTINGKSVTVESEFDEIKDELKTATTLKFVVMRRGRMVTLYLDIPSETLELKAG
jgi:type II secretory pathway component PulC